MNHAKILFYYLGPENRDWEYQDKNTKSPITVSGKIHKKGQFWRETLKASKFVTSIVENGYSLPFERPCPPFAAKNNASSRNNRDFVEEAIEKLLQTNCIRETESVPFVCNPLTVAEGQKLRLVLDLRHVNQYLEQYSFKYEDLKTLTKILSKGFILIASISRMDITIYH